MPKRNEFECEWDDDCEQKIMDIEFTDEDTPEEYEIKMRLLEVYNERISKRHAMRKYATGTFFYLLD
jgi:transcriptional adapter 2-alpha